MAKQTIIWSTPGEAESHFVMDAATARDAAEAIVDNPEFDGLAVRVRAWEGFHATEPDRQPDYEIDNG